MHSPSTMSAYQYTNNWFESTAKRSWDSLIPQLKPTKILEIGSYEGASASYLIEKLGAHQTIELHCIDTWEGGIEHKEKQTDMSSIEKRFYHNMEVAQSKVPHKINLHYHKGYSHEQLAKLITDGKQGYFDFIYVDGSHQAPDVLLDAVLSFKLLKLNGIIAFDDYLWHENLAYGVDPVRCPKIAIDAFTNIYCRKLRILSAPLYQLYVQKTQE